MFIKKYVQKENVDYFTSSTFLRYWGKPIMLKRVNVHAFSVNYLLQFLHYFFQFPNCQKQESKSGCSSYMSFGQLYLSQPIGNLRFYLVRHYLSEQIRVSTSVEHQQLQLVIILFPY